MDCGGADPPQATERLAALLSGARSVLHGSCDREMPFRVRIWLQRGGRFRRAVARVGHLQRILRTWPCQFPTAERQCDAVLRETVYVQRCSSHAPQRTIL